MRKLVLLWTVVWLGIGLTGQTAEGEKYPQPKTAELSRAEKLVDEVFGKDMAKARSAQEKTKLALEMIKTAREEKDSAIRFALAQRAKLLAIQAQDSKQAVQAAEMLAEFEPEGGPLSPKQAADKAHGLWAKSELSKGQERLARRIEAAELYLRAFEELEGFEKAIARNRLKELGWTEFVFAFEFEKDNDTEGWAVRENIIALRQEQGCLKGIISGRDPQLVNTQLQFLASECKQIIIRLRISVGGEAELFWSKHTPAEWYPTQGGRFLLQNDGQWHIYIVPVSDFPSWNGTILGLRIDPLADPPASKQVPFEIDYVLGKR